MIFFFFSNKMYRVRIKKNICIFYFINFYLHTKM